MKKNQIQQVKVQLLMPKDCFQVDETTIKPGKHKLSRKKLVTWFQVEAFQVWKKLYLFLSFILLDKESHLK